jgi:hypothetical protein
MVLLVITFAVRVTLAPVAETVTVHPARDDTMLLNPGKGWVQYYGTDKYTKDFIGVGYTRCCWSDVEPREGQFDWKQIDDFIRQFKQYGKKAAFGVVNVSTGIGRHPSVFEYCDGYSEMKKSGWWKPDMLRNTYISGGKPTYMQWNPRIFEENRDFCLSLGNYIGYHFVLRKAVLPKSFQASSPIHVRFEWLNDGVACLYEPCRVAVALLDGKNKVAQKQWLTESDPGKWAPGQRTTETFDVTFAPVPAGVYKLAVGLFLNPSDTTPAYRLGIQGRTPDGWYAVYDGIECKPSTENPPGR